jgi:hypothetical protein
MPFRQKAAMRPPFFIVWVKSERRQIKAEAV